MTRDEARKAAEVMMHYANGGAVHIDDRLILDPSFSWCKGNYEIYTPPAVQASVNWDYAWQPIETSTRDYYEQVIGYAEGFGVVPMAYANNMWHILEIPIDGYVDHNTECNPTHWMPLPDPPEETERCI